MTMRIDLTRASTRLRRALAGAALLALLMAADTLTAPSVAADHCYPSGPIAVGDIYDPTYTGIYDCHYWGLEDTGSILIEPIAPPVAETGTGYAQYMIDSDGDGLTDGAELDTYGTNPALWDTDGDGAGDGWEATNGYDPLTYNVWVH